MMTQRMNCRIPQRSPEIQDDPPETDMDETMQQSCTEPEMQTDPQMQSEGDYENPRPEPTRGVKKVPSLRRGAAAYAQLLQSAVKASIESRKDVEGDDDDRGPPPPIPDAMDVENSTVCSPSRRNKRSFDQDMDGSYRESAAKLSNRGQRESSEMGC